MQPPRPPGPNARRTVAPPGAPVPLPPKAPARPRAADVLAMSQDPAFQPTAPVQPPKAKTPVLDFEQEPAPEVPKSLPRRRSIRPEDPASLPLPQIAGPAPGAARAKVPQKGQLEPATWPPRNAAGLYQVWLKEMQTKDPAFDGGLKHGATAKDYGVAKNLLEKYDPDTCGDLLLQIIRVAVWDWHIIRGNVSGWYTKDKTQPALQYIAGIVDELGGFVATGVTIVRGHNSRYAERFLQAPKTAEQVAQSTPVGLPAQPAQGKSLSELLQQRRPGTLI